MANTEEDRGRVFETTDVLKTMNSSLSYVKYQIESGGAGGEAEPRRWLDAIGHFRGVLAKEADLAKNLAIQLERWAKDNPGSDPGDLAVVHEASKKLKAIEKSLVNNSGNMGAVKAFLNTFGTPDPDDE